MCNTCPHRTKMADCVNTDTLSLSWTSHNQNIIAYTKSGHIHIGIIYTKYSICTQIRAGVDPYKHILSLLPGSVSTGPSEVWTSTWEKLQVTRLLLWACGLPDNRREKSEECNRHSSLLHQPAAVRMTTHLHFPTTGWPCVQHNSGEGWCSSFCLSLWFWHKYWFGLFIQGFDKCVIAGRREVLWPWRRVLFSAECRLYKYTLLSPFLSKHLFSAPKQWQ